MADLNEFLPTAQEKEINFNTYDEIFSALLRNEKVFLVPIERAQIKKLRTALLTRIKEYNKLQETFGEPKITKCISISLAENKNKTVVQLLEQRPVAEGIQILPAHETIMLDFPLSE